MEKSNRLERFLFKKRETWCVILITISILAGMIMLGYVALKASKTEPENRSQFEETAIDIFVFPEDVKKVFTETNITTTEGITRQKQIREGKGWQYLKKVDGDFQDRGILLVSGYRAKEDVSVAYLYSLKEEKILHKWVPPVEKIHELAPDYVEDENEKLNYKTQHPLLLDNGDIIFTSGEGPLVRLSPCGEVKWAVNEHFHHAIEKTPKGNIIAGYLNEPNQVEPPEQDIIDHGFATVSPKGEVLERYSLAKILIDSGYRGLLYGFWSVPEDLIHLNDAQPIDKTDKYVEKGDIIISPRNISTIIHYRPSTDEVIRARTGPWLNQHDVDYQGNGVFSIFGNDIVLSSKRFVDGHNNIYLWDVKDDSVQKFLPKQMEGVKTKTQGLHRILPNGDVFVEEQESHVLHRIGPSGRRWSFVNSLSKSQNEIGALHWSRYLTPEEADLEWLDKINCRSK